MRKILFTKLKESLLSVLPVSVIVLVLLPFLGFSVKEIVTFAICAVFLVLGISLFNLGADLAMTPMGSHIGAGLTKSKKLIILFSVCFVMGLLITIAEPDLSVLAGQVESVIHPNILLIITVGVGVGIFLVIGVVKIVFKINLSRLLTFFYMVLFAVCAIMAESGKLPFIPLSFDSGGVTTGPITVPFIMALGVGMATTIGGRNANENSFGLIALCSIGPIISVMLLSLFSNGDASVMSGLDQYATVDETLGEFGHILLIKLKDVALALGLIVVFFFILQFTILKLPKRKLMQIGIGIGYAFAGLVIFLVAVEAGFMPIGFKLGQKIAEFNEIALVFFGLGLGLVVVLAEPAIHVLNRQVEEITEGGVKKLEMLIALSLAVGLSIALSLIRTIFQFSVLYYLIPGYIISLGLSFFVPKIYTAIAFDSGGVASGPLTSSFILPFVIGACVAAGGDTSTILNDAFGVVAMVAMTPLIMIQILGFKSVVTSKVRAQLTMRRILSADDEQIINFK